MFSSAEHFTTVRKLVKTDSEAECQRKVRRPNKLYSQQSPQQSQEKSMHYAWLSCEETISATHYPLLTSQKLKKIIKVTHCIQVYSSVGTWKIGWPKQLWHDSVAKPSQAQTCQTQTWQDTLQDETQRSCKIYARLSRNIMVLFHIDYLLVVQASVSV